MLANKLSPFFLLSGLLAVAACGDDDDLFSDPSGGSGGAGVTSSSTTGGQGGSSGGACVDFGDACTACEVSACEAEYCACYGQADCGLYAQCVFDCPAGDNACYQVCNTRYPDAITTAVLLNDCAAEACPTECAGYPLLELDACERCSYEQCEATMNACLAMPSCTSLLACLSDCTDTACQDQCYAAHPDALAEGYAVGTCILGQCSAECS